MMQNEEEITQTLDLDLAPLSEWQTHFCAKEIGSFKGTFVMNFINPYVKCGSIVAASATEVHGGCGHMGAAKIQVLNVSPYNGGVRVRINVDSGSPLPIRVEWL